VFCERPKRHHIHSRSECVCPLPKHEQVEEEKKDDRQPFELSHEEGFSLGGGMSRYKTVLEPFLGFFPAIPPAIPES